MSWRRGRAAPPTRRGCARQIDHLPVDDVHFALRANRELRVMGHHDDGGAVAMQLLEQLHDAARHLRIEIAGGLVRQQQPRRARQRARDRHALLLSARQLRRIVPRRAPTGPPVPKDSWMRRRLSAPLNPR